MKELIKCLEVSLALIELKIEDCEERQKTADKYNFIMYERLKENLQREKNILRKLINYNFHEVEKVKKRIKTYTSYDKESLPF